MIFYTLFDQCAVNYEPEADLREKGALVRFLLR